MKRWGKLGVGVLGALAALLVPTLGYAGGGGGGGPCSGFSSGEQLVMRDSCFDGVAHFAESETTLVVTNAGVRSHSFTAVDGAFDTGVLSPGESTEIKLGEDGVVRVWCTLHGAPHGEGMAGVLLIGEAQVGGIGAESGLASGLAYQNAAIQGALDDQAEAMARIEAALGDSGQHEAIRRIEAALERLVQVSHLLAAGLIASAGLLTATAFGLARRGVWAARSQASAGSIPSKSRSPVAPAAPGG